MFIQKFPSGPISTNAYIVACKATKQALVIDPAFQSADSLLNCLRMHQLNCEKIILTHSHWDHIADISVLNQVLQVPVAIHSLDVPNLERPGADGLPCPLSFPAVKPTLLLEDGMIISLGQLNFQVIHTPGHSPGCICLYEPAQQILLSGDTLFQGSMGNVSFPTSQPSDMWLSLKRLAQLPAATQVHPGHGSSTTIRQEQGWMTRAQDLFQ
jgi:hydroxyacylglutathione hydrolase